MTDSERIAGLLDQIASLRAVAEAARRWRLHEGHDPGSDRYDIDVHMYRLRDAKDDLVAAVDALALPRPLTLDDLNRPTLEEAEAAIREAERRMAEEHAALERKEGAGALPRHEEKPGA